MQILPGLLKQSLTFSLPSIPSRIVQSTTDKKIILIAAACFGLAIVNYLLIRCFCSHSSNRLGKKSDEPKIQVINPPKQTFPLVEILQEDDQLNHTHAPCLKIELQTVFDNTEMLRWFLDFTKNRVRLYFDPKGEL